MSENDSNQYKSSLPRWLYKLPWNDIITAAKYHKVPVQLLSAIIMTESSGNPNCPPRFEKDWKYFFKPEYFAECLNIPIDLERKYQQQSWGLCQVMGSCMREMGYGGPLEKTIDVPINLQYGATKLASLLAKWPNWYDAASAYNHGEPWHSDIDKTVYKNNQYVWTVRSYVRSFGVTSVPNFA